MTCQRIETGAATARRILFGERVVDAIRATATETEEDIAEMEADEAMTRRALDLLGTKRNDAYEAALTALREDTRHWWEDVLAHDPDELEEDQEPYTADAAGLLRFLEGENLCDAPDGAGEPAPDPRAAGRRAWDAAQPRAG